MTKIFCEYTGDLHCTLTHGPSSTVIYTDAPIDNHGKGESFSPTDLVAAALVSCIAVTLALFGSDRNWNLKGMRIEIQKNMMSEPERRIESLLLHMWMPINLSQEERRICQRVAQTCPVHRSLHPGIEISLFFHWPS